MDIYELVIPKDNLLRQIKELVDFGFIHEELIDKYFLDMAPVSWMQPIQNQDTTRKRQGRRF